MTMNKPSAEMMQLLFSLRQQLESAKHGQVGRLVHDFADQHGRSYQTVWRWLGRFAGYQSGRKRRSDAGTTKINEDALLFIAASKNLSVRANGKATKPTGVAANIADANGMAINVSLSTINRQLKQRRLDTKTQANARNHIQMRSLYPNHVHQIDPSLCLIYYVGKKQMVMTEAEFNKNKPTAMEKVKLKVWRYTRWDHASGCIDARYYEAAGENWNSLFEFLMYTWGEQPNRLCYGVPKNLIWDKGSANTSTPVVRFLDALCVNHETHATHHAWAKGGVENANRIVEMHFESRLRDQPVNSVDELNASVALWVRDYNANAIKFVDSRVKRASGERLVRDDLWQLILRTPEALVRLPERKVCQWFLTGREVTRKIVDNMISYAHPELGKSAKYDLRQWAEFYSQKDKVKVEPLLLSKGAVRIEIEQMGKAPLIVQVEPVQAFDAFGHALSAHVFGEGFVRAPRTVAEVSAEAIAQMAYGVNTEEAEDLLRKNAKPFQQFNEGKGIISHTHLGKGELPTRILPQASEINRPELEEAKVRDVAFPRKNHAQMALYLRGHLRDDWDAAMLPDLQKRFPDGATEQDLDQVLADLRAGRSTSGKAKLQAV